MQDRAGESCSPGSVGYKHLSGSSREQERQGTGLPQTGQGQGSPHHGSPCGAWIGRPGQVLCAPCSPPASGGEASTRGLLRHTFGVAAEGMKVPCKQARV